MKKFLLFVTFFVCVFFCYSQSAQKLTEILSSEQINYGNASWFIAAQKGLIDDTKSEKEAFDALSENGYFNYLNAEIENSVSLKNFAYLCAKAYNIRGGIMFRITKSPRYAVRELKAMKIIPNDADPNSIITGRQMINILTNCDYELPEALK